MLEFGLPRGIWRPLWDVWVGVGLPLAGRVISPGWHEVGRFLGPSIRRFHAAYPAPALVVLWRDAGIADVRLRRLSLGGGVVVWGERRSASSGIVRRRLGARCGREAVLAGRATKQRGGSHDEPRDGSGER